VEKVTASSKLLCLRLDLDWSRQICGASVGRGHGMNLELIPTIRRHGISGNFGETQAARD
jgi:hypothetical protein